TELGLADLLVERLAHAKEALDHRRREHQAVGRLHLRVRENGGPERSIGELPATTADEARGLVDARVLDDLGIAQRAHSVFTKQSLDFVRTLAVLAGLVQADDPRELRLVGEARARWRPGHPGPRRR